MFPNLAHHQRLPRHTNLSLGNYDNQPGLATSTLRGREARKFVLT